MIVTEFSLHQLLPHREPMLLLHRAVHVGERAAQAEVLITPQSPFFTSDRGVPSWIGVEYMGQTAALIAGWQLLHGHTRPHVGLLLGTRKYEAETGWFTPGRLLVRCTEEAVVGDGLATFRCEILDRSAASQLARARLSVFRKPVE